MVGKLRSGENTPVVMLSPNARNSVRLSKLDRTVTEKLQLAAKSSAESVEQVTGVVPIGKLDPEAVVHELLVTSPRPIMVGRGKKTGSGFLSLIITSTLAGQLSAVSNP